MNSRDCAVGALIEHIQFDQGPKWADGLDASLCRKWVAVKEGVAVGSQPGTFGSHPLAGLQKEAGSVPGDICHHDVGVPRGRAVVGSGGGGIICLRIVCRGREMRPAAESLPPRQLVHCDQKMVLNQGHPAGGGCPRSAFQNTIRRGRRTG